MLDLAHSVRDFGQFRGLTGQSLFYSLSLLGLDLQIGVQDIEVSFDIVDLIASKMNTVLPLSRIFEPNLHLLLNILHILLILLT